MPFVSNQPTALINDELDVLANLVPLHGTRLIELGCGSARLAIDLLHRYPPRNSRVWRSISASWPKTWHYLPRRGSILSAPGRRLFPLRTACLMAR